jgi:hypothetical protein
MPEFQVNPPGICSICGEEKEPEELSDLDGQLACLDCIAQANVSKNVPLEQLAAANQLTKTQAPRRPSIVKILIGLLIFLIIPIGGASYMWRVRHRQELIRNSVTSLKTEGDQLARAGKLEEAIARYEAVLKQLQNKPLNDPKLVELYHQTEKTAAAPYLKIVQPRLERVEAMLLAGRSEEAREQFRELAKFINAHSIQPELSVRERIDRVTDELRVPRIAKANWRKEIPAVAIGLRPSHIMTQPVQMPEPEPVAQANPTQAPAATNANPAPQPAPSAQIPPIPKPPTPKVIEPVSVPDAASQARAEEQIRARFADKYAQRDALSRRALAHLLLITAQETTSDFTTRYVLLRESRDIAVRVPEPRIALAAVDEMGRSFIVSDVAMLVSTLAESAQNAFTADANEVIAESALDVADRMAAEKHYEEAYRCAVIANAAAQQSRQQALIFKASGKLKELKH